MLPSADAYDAAFIGGIAGQNDVEIFRCCFTGELSAEAMNGAVEMSGIAGADGTVSNCAALGGSISASGNDLYAKRITGGRNTCVTTNNYANDAMTINSGAYTPTSGIDGTDGADVVMQSELLCKA